MSGPRRRPRLLLLGALLAAAAPAGADLNGQLDTLFGSLVNHTAPTAHLGQRRGVITGGEAVVRNRIVNESLFHFVPPSFNAGCGGIDLFAGSFSFISADQFVDVLRAIAANASGYAFQVALGAMCPTCLENIETLMKKIQALNQNFANSCQLAKGLVNDAADAFDLKHKDQTSLLGMLRGLGDVFETRTGATGTDPVRQVNDHLPAEAAARIRGNLVWRALKERGVADWFAGGDERLLEALMSVTGSVIVGELAAAADGAGDNHRITALPGNQLKLIDLLNGTGPLGLQRVTLYRCAPDRSADGCLAPVLEAVDLKGMIARVRELLLGDPVAGAPGLVDKFRAGVGPVTGPEKAFLQNAPNGLGAGVRTLARLDRGMAALYAEQAAPIIAVELVQLMLRDMLRAVQHAATLQDHAYAKQLLLQIETARAELRAEYQVLAGRYGNARELLDYYTRLVEQAKGERYLSAGQARTEPVSQP